MLDDLEMTKIQDLARITRMMRMRMWIVSFAILFGLGYLFFLFYYLKTHPHDGDSDSQPEVVGPS